MKELLEECLKSDRDDLMYLFWHYYNEKRYPEAYFIIHYMVFANMNINFINQSVVETLRTEIE